MSVRDAKFVDVPAMVRVLEDAYHRSIYAGKATFDPDGAKRLFAQAVQRHGHTNCGGSLVQVSEKDGEIEGFLIGVLDIVYPGLLEFMATDLLFYMTERADPRDASRMVKGLIAWAEANPRVIEIHLGLPNVVGNSERTAKLYERLGLERCGAMFRRGFER